MRETTSYFTDIIRLDSQKDVTDNSFAITVEAS